MPSKMDILQDGLEAPYMPYWVTWAHSVYNLFIVSYGLPFAIVQNQWTNEHDHDYSYNLDIYTYKNGKWVLDNQNILYKPLRKIIDQAKNDKKSMALRCGRDRGFIQIYTELDESHEFNVWESLEEYVPEPEVIIPGER